MRRYPLRKTGACWRAAPRGPARGPAAPGRRAVSRASVRGPVAQLLQREMHRRQRRDQVAQRLDVVEAGHGHVVGDPQPTLAQGRHRADGHDVVAGEHAGGRGPRRPAPPAAAYPPSRVNAAVDDPDAVGLDAGARQAVDEPGEPVAGRQQVRGPGQHGEPAVPEAGQLDAPARGRPPGSARARCSCPGGSGTRTRPVRRTPCSPPPPWRGGPSTSRSVVRLPTTITARACWARSAATYSISRSGSRRVLASTTIRPRCSHWRMTPSAMAEK